MRKTSILDDDEQILYKQQIRLAIEEENKRMAHVRGLLERIFGNNYSEENPNKYLQ